MKKGFGLLILFFVCNILQGQTYDEIIDDLRQQLNTHSTQDEKRVDLLNDLSYAYRRNSPEKVDSFAKEALRLAEKLNYLKGTGIAYKNRGIFMTNGGGSRDSILLFFQKCYDLAEQSKDYYNQAACSHNIGYVYKISLRYDKSIEAFQKGYDIHAAHFPVDRLRMLIIGNIGKTYANAQDYENARVYLERVMALASEHDNPAITAMYMQDYALVQYKQDEVDEAIETLTKNLPIAKDVGDYMTFVQSTITLSEILIEERQFDKADTFLKQGLQIAEQQNFPAHKCEINLNRSTVLFHKQKLNEALKLGKDAYHCSADNEQLRLKATKNLLNIRLATNDITQSKELFPIYNDLMERQFDTEQQKTHAILEMKKKETTNAELKSQQVENKATIRVQRILAWSILLIGLLATGTALYAYRIKRVQNNLLEKKVEERTQALNQSNRELEYSNQQLEKSNTELERSNEELERFAYIASHDLKQPLNNVINFSKLLNEKLEDTTEPKVKTYLRFIIQGGTRMRDLIEDILEYSKLNETKKEHQNINLNALIDEVTDSLSEFIGEKNAQVNVIGTFPTLKHDKTNTFLLFRNLIENGIQYNQSEIPIVNIQHSVNGYFTRLSFTDNGIGIEEQYFPKLFKMFIRLQNHKDYEGTGIGLSVCKKIVNNIGGDISVESQPGKGSTFHVDIPSDLFVQKENIRQLAEIA